MTTQALERAEKAVWDAVRENNDEKSSGYAGTMHGSPYYVDGFIDPAAIARDVLMAVLPTLERYSLIYDLEPDPEGGLVYFWDLEAILNDGEGE